MAQSTLDDIIRKIEALLTQADHPNTGKAEAEVFRAKAEALMFKYRLEEVTFNSSGVHAPSDPLPQWADLDVCPWQSNFGWAYRWLLESVVNHFDARVSFDTDAREGGTWTVARVVAYESDLRFMRVLWQSIRIAFQSRLEPKYDPDLSEAENAYRLRAAGTEGARMAYILYQGDTSKGKRVRARKLAKEFAISIGEDPSAFSGQGNDMKLYRESYAQGFVTTIRSRLLTMRNSREPGQAGEIVLASRKDRIDEAFYERYPNRRPKPAVAEASESTYKAQAQCGKCAKAKSGYCRDHGWMRPRKGKVRYANGAALEAGRAAARTVDMGISGREVR